MHRILERQIRKILGDSPLPQEWSAFFEAVSSTYQNFDEDKELVSRSLDLTSHELTSRNAILKENERKLSTLIHNFPGVVYRCFNDKDWTLEFISDGCKELTGYAPEDFVEKRLITHEAIIHPEDRKKVREDAQLAFEKNAPFFLTYRIITSSGEEKWVQDKGNQVGVTEGGMEIIEGVFFDITDIKKDQENLELLKNVVEQISDIVLVTTSELELPGPHIIFVNSSFTRMMGYSSGEVIGKTPRMLQGPLSDRKMLAEMKVALQRGDPFSGETTDYRKDGTPIDVQIHITPLKNRRGEVTHFVSIQRDITERKKTEENLLRLASIIKSANDAIISTTIEGIIVNWNQGAEVLYGYTAEEAIGKNILIIFPDDKREKAEASDEKSKKIESVQEYEAARKRKDGTIIPVALTRSPVVDRNGIIVGIVSIQRDITRRKKAEQEIKRLNETLAVRLAEVERFNKFTIGRELRMVQLKKKIKELEKQLGIYKDPEEDAAARGNG